MTLPSYLINLAARRDRLRNSQLEADRVRLPFTRVEAVEASAVDPDVRDVTQLSAGRIACWLSHRRVWELGAAGSSPYFLVLEDDIRWIRNPQPLVHALARHSGEEFDILQLGSLQHGPTFVPARAVIAHRLAKAVRVARTVTRRADDVEEWLVNRSQLMSQSMRDELTVAGLDGQVLWGSFGSGTHAYVVGRQMAAHLLNFNEPPFLAADDALDALARQRTFMIGELRSSIATQAPISSDLR